MSHLKILGARKFHHDDSQLLGPLYNM